MKKHLIIIAFSIIIEQRILVVSKGKSTTFIGEMAIMPCVKKNEIRKQSCAG